MNAVKLPTLLEWVLFWVFLRLLSSWRRPRHSVTVKVHPKR